MFSVSLSGAVSITAKPAAIRFLTPSHFAAAYRGLWKRIFALSLSSFDRVAKVEPNFSSSRQAFMYSGISLFRSTISAGLSTLLPSMPTNPSNMLRAARTSTAFAPQAHPTSSFLIPFGRAMPRFTLFRLIAPS